MRYVESRWKQSIKDEAYRIYCTDALRIITENTAKQVGGSYVNKRWIETIRPQKQDKRTGEQVAQDVIKNVGLEVKHHECS